MITVYDAPVSERRRAVLLSLEKLAQSFVDGFLLLDIWSLVVARVARSSHYSFFTYFSSEMGHFFPFLAPSKSLTVH